MNRKQGKKKPPPLSLRLTDAERTALEKAAGTLSLSAYVRDRVFGDGAQTRKLRSRNPVKDHEALGRVLGLLGQSQMANALNQLAQHADNGSLLLDDETIRKINEAHQHIQIMRSELISALGLMDGQRK